MAGFNGFRGVMLVGWLLLTAGCDGMSSPALPTTLEGAWLGEGQFNTRAGSMDVKAQLELLSDGTYRYLILEPGVLAMMGDERGRWSRQGQTLTLTPGSAAAPPQTPTATPNDSVVERLRQSGAASPRPAKQLEIAGDLSDLRFDDGKLEITFTPNPAATAKLQAAGEVTGP